MPPRIYYRVLVSLCCLLLQLKSYAQPPDLKFKNYDNINGIENRNSVVRDSLGYLWLTGNGVARFDGYQLKSYRRDDKDPHALRSDNTNDLMVDQQGTVWLVSGGLCYYNSAINGFVYVILSTDKNVTSNYAVVYDDQETIWFCSQQGLYRINTTNKTVSKTSLKKCPYPAKAAIDNRGNIWISLNGGSLLVYNPALDAVTKYPVYEGNAFARLGNVFFTKQHKLWLASNGRLVEIDPQHPTDQQGNLVYEELPGLQQVILSVWNHPLQYLPAYTGDSIVWMATESHGLITYNSRQRQVVASYLPDTNNPNSISSNIPRSLYVDKDNHLWITQGIGLTLLNVDNQNFKSRVLNELDRQYARIIVLEKDKADKEMVWMGTNYGLIQYNWAQKHTATYIPRWGPLNASNANALCDDGSGNIWIGSVNTLYRYNKQSHAFTQYPPLPTEHPFGYETVINKIMCLHDTVLMATTTGLIAYLAKSKQYRILYTGVDEGMDYNSFNLADMACDKEGMLWCAGYKGLLKYNLNNNRHWLYLFRDGDVNGFNRNNGLAFLGDTIALAASAGITFFNTKTYRYSKLASDGEVDLNNSWDVMADSLHNLWISTYYGLVHYNLATKHHETFTVADGLPRSFSNTWVDLIDNNIVFKWRNKFSYINPYTVEKNNSLPQVVITDFRIFEQPVLFDPKQVKQQRFNLTYQQNFVSFDFNAFEFNYPDKVQYAYRLKGFDKDWIFSGNKKTATYTNLPGGDYVFEVKAANSNGLWSQPAIFRMYIKAAFWQTAWFEIAVALMVVVLLYVMVQKRIQHIRNEENRKREHERELLELELKTMRSQMNPHFIFNSLNSIQKYIWENKQEDTAEYLSKFSRLMRMTLDNSMQKWITLEQELNALVLYIELEHRRSNNKFNYQVHVSEHLDVATILVPPLILQPYVENAIWHGLLPKDGHGELRIAVMPGTRSTITCTIEDNGIGRSANGNGIANNESKRVSYGMQLTRQRIVMTEANGQSGEVVVEDVMAENNGASGTRVTIHLPLNNFIKL